MPSVKRPSLLSWCHRWGLFKKKCQCQHAIPLVWTTQVELSLEVLQQIFKHATTYRRSLRWPIWNSSRHHTCRIMLRISAIRRWLCNHVVASSGVFRSQTITSYFFVDVLVYPIAFARLTRSMPSPSHQHFSLSLFKISQAASHFAIATRDFEGNFPWLSFSSW